ncbi:MAG: ABC transporter permease [Gemmatimonadetes bacterium]|nr:ABC transporter permease [Gemmatimonadota bacterium]
MIESPGALSFMTGYLAAAVGLAVPLALAALGEAVSERAGVINIGLEGSVIWGALGGTMGALAWGPYLGLLAGAGAGAGAAAVFGLFAVRLNTDQIITGTAISVGSLGFTGALFQSRFGSGGVGLDVPTVPSWPLPVLSEIPLLGPTVLDQPATGYALLVLVPLVAWFLGSTRGGLALRAVGEDPGAAEAAGVRVIRVRLLAVLFAGLLAGLAGAHLSLVHTGTFQEGMSAGKGFIAIAVVVLGRWSPWSILAAAGLFGAAEALQFSLQALDLDFPYPLLLALPYVMSLAALAGWFGRARAPAALALPWPSGPGGS